MLNKQELVGISFAVLFKYKVMDSRREKMAICTKRVASKLFRELWMRAFKEFGFGKKLHDNGINICFVVYEPDMTMFVDKNGALFGTEAEKKTPVITMKMNGDIAHKYWLNDLNIAKALALHQVVATGPVNKILELQSIIKPAMQIYPECCRKYNLPIK